MLIQYKLTLIVQIYLKFFDRLQHKGFFAESGVICTPTAAIKWA